MSKSPNNNRRHLLGHNFGIVYRFEVIRMLKKKSFWLSIIAFPLLLAGIFAISFFANASSDDLTDKLADQSFSMAVTDDSQLINDELLKQLNIQTVDNPEQGIKMVKSNEVEAYVYYPADLSKNKIEVYGQHIGLFDNGKYSTVATQLLQNSVQADIDANTIAVLSDNITSDSHYYRNGEEYNMLGDMVVPIAFLVLFYLIICIFSGQMLTATVEEKENRITEMLLTTIKPSTLISGKIFAFITLILVQVLVIIGLVVAGYLVVARFVELPNLDLSFITFDPARIAIAAALFIVSILMYAGIMVAIGAATPTAKEANNFLSIPVLLMIIPLYFISTAISTPNDPTVVAMMYFPLTAPILLMTMNALGILSISSAMIGLAIMTVTTIIIFIIAAKLFQTGAIEYHRRIQLFRKKPNQKAS